MEKNIFEKFIKTAKNIYYDDSFNDDIILIALFKAASINIYDKAKIQIKNNIRNIGKVKPKKSIKLFISELKNNNKKEKNKIKHIKESDLKILDKSMPFLQSIIDLDDVYIKAIAPFLIWCFQTNMDVKSSNDIKKSLRYNSLKKVKENLTILNSSEDKQKNYFLSNSNSIIGYKNYKDYKDYIYYLQTKKFKFVKTYIDKFDYKLFKITDRKYNKHIGKNETISERNKLNYFFSLLFNDIDWNYTLSVLLFDTKTLLFRQIPSVINIYFDMIYYTFETEKPCGNLNSLEYSEKTDEYANKLLSNTDSAILIEDITNFLLKEDVMKDSITFIAENYKSNKKIEKRYDDKYWLNYIKEICKDRVNPHFEDFQNYIESENIDNWEYINILKTVIDYSKKLELLCNDYDNDEAKEEINNILEMINILIDKYEIKKSKTGNLLI